MPTSPRSATLAVLTWCLAACSDALPPENPVSEEVATSIAPLFTNSGFEDGTLASWAVTTGLSSSQGPLLPVAQESNLRLTWGGGVNRTFVRTGAPFTLIPAGLTATEKARYPRYGNWAAVVNELGSSYNANRITQETLVTPADIDPIDGLVHVRFTALPVLQNPGHTVREQPYYYVSVTNETKGTVLASRFNFSNEAGVPWQTNVNASVVYTDWLLFDLPLSRHAVSIGDTLKATIVAVGCAQSGHWGQVIVDSFGATIPGLVAYAAGPNSVEAGADFQYTYRIVNGSTATNTGVRFTSYLPAGTTFRSIDTPGVTCTRPTVGTRGTVVCDLSAIPAGGSSLIRITVRADTTAAPEIRHGWYVAQSNEEQPLVGPLVSTAVTTGGTTQYVDLRTSVSDATASVIWGQTNTWSVTVSNEGPGTATGAAIVTNSPASLSGLTWLCTPLAGATCGAASGTGPLDTTATIPAGGSVTYTVEATVASGSGSGLLSFTAYATAGAPTVERYALDNGAGDDDTINTSLAIVTAARAGAGSGTISSSPSAIVCGPGCTSTSAAFAVGSPVAFHAVPAAGSVFAGWSGPCTGSGTCSFTLAAPGTVTATFLPSPVLITSPGTATGAVGRAFSYTLTALGEGGLTFDATGLPGWLAFDAQAATLSGTPTAAGTFSLTLSATNGVSTDTRALTITTGVAPTITSSLTHTRATATSAWNGLPAITVAASGTGPLQYNASNLPGTVYFNSTTGAFMGNAGATGVFNVAVVATNAFGSDYRVLAVSVGGSPVITSPLTATATVGVPFTYTLTSTGSAPLTLNTTGLPAWAGFDAATGVISGTPTAAGALSIGLSATNPVATSQQTLTLTVEGPAVITSSPSVSGTAGQAVSYSMTAEGTGPITVAMSELPAWASFDAASGLLTGTPPVPGAFTATMTATNALGSDTRTLTLSIAAPPPTPTPPVITSALTATAIAGSSFSYATTASGQVPMTFSASGLPAWASIDLNTGIITGTPVVAGAASITLTATNALGDDSKTVTLTVLAPPSITSPGSAAGVVGQAFGYTVTAAGSAPMTLSASGLPAWASFDSGTGVISGTPDGEASFVITVHATNAAGAAQQAVSVIIRTVPLITSVLAADAVVGVPFSYTITASGSAPLTSSASNLPGWASFAAGTVSGTPNAEGLVSIGLSATNPAGSDARTLALTVRTPPAITSALSADAVVGVAFEYVLTATGTAPLSLSVGNLPAWASFDPGTGRVWGSPTAAGSVGIVLDATNAAGSEARTLTITVRTVPAITSGASAAAVVGVPFSFTVTASGTAPLTLSAAGLPAWATFDAQTGVLSGTPDADGDSTITFGVSNAAGSASQSFSLSTRTRPAITSALEAAAVVGQAFSYTLTTSGSGPMTLNASALPGWASFDAQSGVISGAPDAAGVVSLSVSATNSAGADSQTLVITVRELPAITSALVAQGVVGQPFDYQVETSGTAPLTLSVSGLPGWASFDAQTGRITGVPTDDASFTLVLTVTNAAGSDSRDLSLLTHTAPLITSANAALTAVGLSFTHPLTASGTAPITFSASGLPPGLTLQNGALQGTATQAGTFVLTVAATNAAGSATQALTLSIRGPVPTPVIDGPAQGSHVGSITPQVTGHAPAAEAGSQVLVTQGGVLVCTAVVQSDGAWACTTSELGEGSHSLEARLRDAQGLPGLGASATTFIIDVTAPVAAAWAGPGEGARSTSARPMLTGSGEPGATVTVRHEGEVVCTAVVSTQGLWTCAPSADLPEGELSLVVTQRDAAGNEGPATTRSFTIDTLAPAAITLSAPAEGALLATRTPAITGFAEPGSTVTISIDGEVACTAAADGEGAFSCTPASVTDGAHTISAVSTDAAGNQSEASTRTVRVDATAPNAPVVQGPVVDGAYVRTSRPVFSGTAEPYTTVTVTIDGAVACVATADAAGQWVCPAVELAVGPHGYSVTTRDAAGNDSPAAAGSLDVQVARGDLGTLGTGSPSDNTTLTGTGTPGSTVNVYVDGVLVGTTTVGADGSWSFSLPVMSVGDHEVTVGFTNADGVEVFRAEPTVHQVRSSKVGLGGGLSCSQSGGSPAWLLLAGLMVLVLRRRAVTADRPVSSERASRAGVTRPSLRAAAAALALLGTTAQAQVAVSGFDLSQLTMNPSAKGGLLVGGGELLSRGDFRVAASLGYEHAPLVYLENGVRVASLVEHRWTTALSGAWSPLAWLEVGATLPLVVHQSGATVRSSMGETVVLPVQRGATLGTPWLQTKVGALREAAGHPLDLSVTLGLGIPLGGTAQLASEATTAGLVVVGAGKRVGPVRLAVEAGVLLRGETVLLEGLSAAPLRVGSRLQLGVGATTLGTGLRGELSLRAFAPLTNQAASAELLAGVRYAFGDLEAFAVAGPGFGNAPGTPAARALVGLSWGGQRDARCASGGTQEPALCPALDFDHDGVLNRADACPELAAAGRKDGCPTRDADGDGTEDALDTCPAVAGLAALGGCPRVDSDADGVEDGADLCPNEAGPQARRGCPVRDADGDGHRDEVDVCPHETAADTADGCPVQAAPALVEVKRDHLELKAKAHFDTSKPTLQERSFPVLDEVAAVLKAHPELGRFFIDGHTDSRGAAAFNQQLSLDRARAVRAYLMRAGVDGARLEARGFGAAQPMATNDTDEGREANRRVEFLSRE